MGKDMNAAIAQATKFYTDHYGQGRYDISSKKYLAMLELLELKDQLCNAEIKREKWYRYKQMFAHDPYDTFRAGYINKWKFYVAKCKALRLQIKELEKNL